VSQKSQAIAAAMVGGVLGAVAGYMFFTDQGRAWRRQLEPAIEDMARELAQFRGTLTRAMGVANEGWRVLNDALGEHSGPSHYPNPHQSTPF
jgi:hypothetical protein